MFPGAGVSASEDLNQRWDILSIECFEYLGFIEFPDRDLNLVDLYHFVAERRNPVARYDIGAMYAKEWSLGQHGFNGGERVFGDDGALLGEHFDVVAHAFDVEHVV